MSAPSATAKGIRRLSGLRPLPCCQLGFSERLLSGAPSCISKQWPQKNACHLDMWHASDLFAVLFSIVCGMMCLFLSGLSSWEARTWRSPRWDRQCPLLFQTSVKILFKATAEWTPNMAPDAESNHHLSDFQMDWPDCAVDEDVNAGGFGELWGHLLAPVNQVPFLQRKLPWMPSCVGWTFSWSPHVCVFLWICCLVRPYHVKCTLVLTSLVKSGCWSGARRRARTQLFFACLYHGLALQCYEELRVVLPTCNETEPCEQLDTTSRSVSFIHSKVASEELGRTKTTLLDDLVLVLDDLLVLVFMGEGQASIWVVRALNWGPRVFSKEFYLLQQQGSWSVLHDVASITSMVCFLFQDGEATSMCQTCCNWSFCWCR